MNLNKFLMKDSSGVRSVTVTAYVIGFLIINLKLILSGMTIGGLTIVPFTGGEYAAALGALGGVYILRRNTDKDRKTKVESAQKDDV